MCKKNVEELEFSHVQFRDMWRLLFCSEIPKIFSIVSLYLIQSKA